MLVTPSREEDSTSPDSGLMRSGRFPVNGAAFGRFLRTSADPVEAFEEEAVWIMKIHLLDPITAQHGAAQNLSAVLLERALDCREVFDLEGQVRRQAGVFGRTCVYKSGWGCGLACHDQVQLAVVAALEPGSGELEIGWTRNLSHLQYCPVKPARPLKVTHDQAAVL